MFFLFPFLANPPGQPAARPSLQRALLSSLPAPRSTRALPKDDNALAAAISQAGDAGVELLKLALTSMALPAAAFGNRTNAMFGQIAAGLAYQRVARETAALMGAFWPGSTQAPRIGIAGPWLPPQPEPLLFACFGMPGCPANPWTLDPWSALAGPLGVWARLLAPAAPQRRDPYGAQPAVKVTFAFPGFTWTLAVAQPER